MIVPPLAKVRALVWVAKRIRNAILRRKLRKASERGELIDLGTLKLEADMNLNAIFGALKSKTVWWGLAQVLAAATVGYFQDTLLPLMKESPQATLFVTGVASIILRAVTKKPLAEK